MERLYTLCILSMMALASHAQLVINEIMQSNVDCTMDDQNDFPDSWIELFNTNTSFEYLKEYKIGLTKNASEAWPLGTSMIHPDGYVMVYCDKLATGIHTDFKLDSDAGTSIYLFKNDAIVDKYIDIPEQLAPNVAYGRRLNGSDEIGFLQVPTPSLSNCGQICTDVLGKPVFSIPGFVKPSTESVTLELSMPEGTPAGTVIRYTIDGSEPTSKSNLYSNPLKFSASRVIRAKLFCDGYASRPSTCESYIFHGRDVTLPVVSIVTDNSYFYDNKKGIYVNGTYSSSKKNYEYDWRRPINLEYFVPTEDESVINQLGETRISGAASRGCQLKSLTVYANKRFGKKRLKYEFFPTQRPGIDKFKAIILRNAGNDFDYLYMRDAFIQRCVAENADLDWQAYQPAIFYLNGKYMGMLNVRERSNDDNIWENYEGLEDIDMIENFGDLKAGDWTAYNEFQDFYKETGHTYAEYDERMDLNEFQNYVLMELFFNNLDWPGNNYMQWRPREEGGKWRWVAKDVDYTIGIYDIPSNYNTIEWFYDNNYDANRKWANLDYATRLFRRLMDIDQFKWEFLDKVAVYTGDFMSYDRMKSLMDEMADYISYEYPNHRKLINQWWPNYSDELTKAEKWLKQRQGYFFKHLASKYGIDSYLTGRINNNLSADECSTLNISVNNISLTQGSLNGRFFCGRTLNISGTCTDETKEIKGWTVYAIGTDGHSTTTTMDGNNINYTPVATSLVEINAILGENTGIDDAMMGCLFNAHAEGGRLYIESQTAENIFVYDLNGRMVYRAHDTKNADTQVCRGVYIVKCGSMSKKIVVD